ncbi:MAG: hypothetical protein Q8Q20_03480 [bacterium]|nr:hypothetical protein [bacterium]
MPRQVTRTVTQYVTDCQVEIEVGKEYPLDHFERVSLTEDVFHDVSGQAIQVLFRVRDEYYNHLSRSAIKFFAADEVEFYVTDGESRFIQVEDLGGRRVIRIYAREAEPLDASPNTVYASCSHLNGD